MANETDPVDTHAAGRESRSEESTPLATPLSVLPRPIVEILTQPAWFYPDVEPTLPGVGLDHEVPQVKLRDCKGDRFSGPWLKEILSLEVPEFTNARYGSELDNLLDQEAPPPWPACELAADWRFDQISAVTDQESLSLIDSLLNQNLHPVEQGNALPAFVHNLERGVQKIHPKMRASAVAHFWQSREALRWLQHCLSTMDRAGVPPLVLTNAVAWVMDRLRSYVQMVETLSPRKSEGEPQEKAHPPKGRPPLVTEDVRIKAQKVLTSVIQEYGEDWARSPRSGDAVLDACEGFDREEIRPPTPWLKYGIQTWTAAAEGEGTHPLPKGWINQVIKDIRYRTSQSRR